VRIITYQALSNLEAVDGDARQTITISISCSELSGLPDPELLLFNAVGSPEKPSCDHYGAVLNICFLCTPLSKKTCRTTMKE